MSLPTQSKILRALQEQKFHRVGGTRTLSVDVRIIASTNKALPEEIDAGRFREDLYYRLNVIPIHVPPLRERRQDIPMLVESFLSEGADRYHGKPKHMTPEAMDLLIKAPWHGNVRELKNLIERLSIMVKQDEIQISDLPPSYRPEHHQHPPIQSTAAFSINSLDDARKAFEAAYIRQKLAEHHQNPDKTAAAIGISPAELKAKIKKNIV